LGGKILDRSLTVAVRGEGNGREEVDMRMMAERYGYRDIFTGVRGTRYNPGLP
jgi:hypothetical protein